MKTLALSLFLAWSAGWAFAQPQGTAFTYQGRLGDNGAPAQGTFDFRVVLYDAPFGGNAVGPIADRPDVVVAQGLFTLSLDFGPTAFVGTQRFVELSVRPGASTGTYTPLGARQELTPAPAAIFSARTPWSGLSGLPSGFADDNDDDTLAGLSCAGGQIPKWGGASWSCSADEGTTYGAGSGLQLVSNVFSLAAEGVSQVHLAPASVVESKLASASVSTAKLANGAVDASKLADLAVTTSKIQSGAVTGAQIATATIPFGDLSPNGCALNEIVKFNGAVWGCGADANSGGDITAVSAGSGLAGGATTGDASLAVAFGGSGAATTVARSDHDHGAAYAAAAHNHAGESWLSAASPVLTVQSSGAIGFTAQTTSGAANARAVFASANSGTGTTMAVWGSAASSAGTGVFGDATAPGSTAVGVGVSGRSAGPLGTGVLGTSSATSGLGIGVRGVSNSAAGVVGQGPLQGVLGVVTSTTSQAVGVQGTSDALSGRGVYGHSTNQGSTSIGVLGQVDGRTGRGVMGLSTSTDGLGTAAVYGEVTSSTGKGVYGLAVASTGINYGVYGESRSAVGWAGYFEGNVQVTGVVSRPAEELKIDHPLDPENRYLLHAGVASPEMKNLYDGVVTTDGDGYATVELPDWFEALNRDFRYQLTVLDDVDGAGFVQAKVVSKIAAGRFRLRTSAPRTEVSWLVTGIRRDRFAERHRLAVERRKEGDERGTYLHPSDWDQPTERGLAARRRPQEP